MLTHDEGRKWVAISHLIYSSDLKKYPLHNEHRIFSEKITFRLDKSLFSKG